MSSTLESRAEVLKLARVLGTEPERVEFLAELGASDLRLLREAATDRLFDAHAGALGRIAAASKLVPGAVAAQVAQRAFGPLLCARVAGRLDPARAVDIAGRLPAPFLADVAVELDPRRAVAVIARIPPGLVADVAAELSARGEEIAMGRFLAHVPDASIAAALARLSDDALLRTGFVVEDKDRLDHVVGMLPEERFAGLIRAAHEHGLWAQALDLVGHVGAGRRSAIAEAAAAQDDKVLTSLVEAADKEGMWDALLPFVQSMSPPSRQRFATLAAIHQAEVLAGIVRAAALQHSLWPHLLPLVPELPPQARKAVAAHAAALDRAVIEAAVVAAGEAELWSELVTLAAEIEPEERGELLEAVMEGPAAQLTGLAAGIAEAVDDPEVAARALALLDDLEEERQARLAVAVAEIPAEDRARLLARARELGVLESLEGSLRAALEGTPS